MPTLHRVAKTKTMETAWDLVSRLAAVCPFNQFVVLLEKQGDGPVVHAVGAWHRIDREKAEEVVAEMRVKWIAGAIRSRTTS